MNITVKVDELTLGTVIEEAITGWDGDDAPYEEQAPVTIASLIAAQAVERLARDEDRWNHLARKVTEIRAEMIREAVRPAIEEAVHGPIRKTNHYGEPVGTETTTLRDLIADEARKILTQRAGEYSRNGETVISKIVSEEVHKAFAAEIKDAVQQARASIADEIGKQVASAVAAAMKGR